MEIFNILLGAALIIFNKFLAKVVIDSQNKTWGKRFGVKDEKVSSYVIIFVGLGFILFGILDL